MAAESFDFIIVGAGSSGCALAHRLVTSTSASVLLLEAGPDMHRQWSAMPRPGP